MNGSNDPPLHFISSGGRRVCRGAAGVSGLGKSSLGIGDGVEEELEALRAVVGFEFATHVREGVEKKLSNVGLSAGVAAVNLLARHQLEEIAEKEVDVGWR